MGRIGMKCRPRRWLWGFLPLILPFWGAVYLNAPLLEQQLSGNAAAALLGQGVRWANVDMDGRDAMLSGKAPSTEEVLRARDIVASLRGVRRVDTRDVTIDSTQWRRPAKSQVVVSSLETQKAGERLRFDAIYTNDRPRSGVMGIALFHVWEGGGPADPVTGRNPNPPPPASPAKPLPGRARFTG